MISVGDVLVFGVPCELVPYNTQQTTAKLKRNTSCGVFLLSFSACCPHSVVSFLISLRDNVELYLNLALVGLSKTSLSKKTGLRTKD